MRYRRRSPRSALVTKINCASLPVSLTSHTHLLVQWSADCRCWQMLTICYFLAAVEGWLQNPRNGKETPQDMTFCFTQRPSSSQCRFSEKTDIQWQAIISFASHLTVLFSVGRSSLFPNCSYSLSKIICIIRTLLSWNMNFRMKHCLGSSNKASGPGKEWNHPNKVIGISLNEERNQQAPEGARYGTDSKDGM